MTATTETRENLTGALIRQWEQTGMKLAKLATAVPEKFYDVATVREVRTFSDVLRHVVFWNRYVAESVRGNNPSGEDNEVARREFPSKRLLLAELDRTINQAADALKEHASEFDPATGEMLMSFIGHNCEHYGQLVVYARIHGIVPPASQEPS